MAKLDISFLADRPEALTTVSEMVHGEWGGKFHRTLEQTESDFREMLHRNQIPFTLVGYLDGKLVATSTVVACDLSDRKDLSPWLAAVYVDASQRGRGYGAALVRAACERVASLGNERLYLYTESAPGFYEKLGWTTLETRTYLGDRIAVMAYELHSAAPSRRSQRAEPAARSDS